MRAELNRLQQELRAAISDAVPSDLGSGPAGKWTPGQILEHLWLSYHHTNKGLARCMAKGAPLATSTNMKLRVKTFVVTRLGYFPSRAKAPERTAPRGKPTEEVLGSIFDEIAQMDAALEVCEQKFGRRTKLLDHPILGPLNSEEWRAFHLIHGRHHARQIRERIKPGVA